MEWCGLSLDKKKNAAVSAPKVLFRPCNARIHAYVIPSDEEAIIARATARLFHENRARNELY